MSASVTFKVDGVKWKNVLKGLSAVIDDANLNFVPNELDFVEMNDDADPESIQEKEKYIEQLERESSAPIFDRSQNFPGIHLSALTNSHASMTLLSLPPGFFISYFARKPVTIGINFSDKSPGLWHHLNPYLIGDCEVTVDIFDENNVSPFIRHTIFNRITKSTTSIEYHILEITDTTLQVDYAYCAKAVLHANRFHKDIDSMKSYDAPIKVAFSNSPSSLSEKKSVILQCSGIIAQVKISFPVHEEDSCEEHDDSIANDVVKREEEEQEFIGEDVMAMYKSYYNTIPASLQHTIGNEEEEEFSIGMPSSREKRKRTSSLKKKKKKKKKKDMSASVCISLDSIRPSYDLLIAHEFLSTATIPLAKFLTLYWGDPAEKEGMPIVIEHDLGEGGRLAHIIASQISDEDYDDMIKK